MAIQKIRMNPRRIGYDEFIGYYGQILFQRYVNFMCDHPLDTMLNMMPYMKCSFFVNLKENKQPSEKITLQTEKTIEIKEITTWACRQKRQERTRVKKSNNNRVIKDSESIRSSDVITDWRDVLYREKIIEQKDVISTYHYISDGNPIEVECPGLIITGPTSDIGIQCDIADVLNIGPIMDDETPPTTDTNGESYIEVTSTSCQTDDLDDTKNNNLNEVTRTGLLTRFEKKVNSHSSSSSDCDY
jgi:hypothetical protein